MLFFVRLTPPRGGVGVVITETVGTTEEVGLGVSKQSTKKSEMLMGPSSLQEPTVLSSWKVALLINFILQL